VSSLYVLVEGRSEEQFVQQALVPHLGGLGVFASAMCLTTSCPRDRPDLAHKGGVPPYGKVHRELTRMLKQHDRPDAWVTTMIDLYALPGDFPGYAEAARTRSGTARAQSIEDAFREDVGDRRFLPYIQVHEFEALLLAAPEHFRVWALGEEAGIRALAAEVSAAGEPEDIDDGPETAPSKRIEKHLPGYSRQKPTASSLVAQAIGLAIMRNRCPHFSQWLERLEQLGQVR
jgi:hypothetical protein